MVWDSYKVQQGKVTLPNNKVSKTMGSLGYGWRKYTVQGQEGGGIDCCWIK